MNTMIALISHKNLTAMREPTPQLRNILLNTSLFRMLSAPQLDRIVASTSAVRVGSHVCIVNQGELADGAYWVVYGQVNVATCSKHGGEKMLAILGPGKCFGLGEMLLEQPHQASVTSSTNAMLLHVERAAMLAVAEANFGFAHEVMLCLGRQFYGLMSDIGNSSLSANERVAAFLLRRRAGCTDNRIELVANKADIAKRLSLTPETLSRVLHTMRVDGVISVDGRCITVLDWDKLGASLA